MMITKWILLISVLKFSHGIISKEKATTVSCGDGEKCINFMNCDNRTLNTHGNQIVDIRAGSEVKCTSYMEVCCQFSNIRETRKVPEYEVPTKCGISNKNGVGMQIKETIDREAEFGEFPWMVLVLNKPAENKEMYICGGSLIHPSVVLTVGNKFVGKDHKFLSVRAGEWDTKDTKEPLPFVESDVASIKIHEMLNSSTGIYDIALLFLATPIARDQHINTICLPPLHFNFDDAECFVTGWGKKTSGSEGIYPNILKKIKLSVIKSQTCQEMFRKTLLGTFFELHQNLICAGGKKGEDACTGDGGSPLVCPVPGNSGRYYQAGIVAWGIGCGEANIPGAYINVAIYYNWIEEQIQYEGYEGISYTF